MISKQVKLLLATAFLVLAANSTVRPLSAQQSGTLVLSLKEYSTEAKLPKNVKKGLEHAGLRWGLTDQLLLISMVNEKYVKADLPYLTRFGEQKNLELKPGHYSITCIGFEFVSTSSDPEKVLDKSAFFNEGVASFTIESGKTTTLEISPIVEGESQWRLLAKLTFYIPTLKLRSLENGEMKLDGVVLNHRSPTSIAWTAYHGPLKF